jgi:hypothetical protein
MKQKRFSPYDRAMQYLVNEFQTLYEEGYNTQEEYLQAVDGLSEMSAAEVMHMYKEWKELEE